MTIIIKAIGKERSQELHSLCNEYLMRSKWAIKVYEHEVHKAGATQNIQFLEEKFLLEKIPLNSYIYVLDSSGVQLSSLEFAHHLVNNRTNFNNIYFLIGGAFGL